MKRVNLALMLISALIGQAAGQKPAGEARTGIITYEEITKLEIKLEGENARLLKDLPTERTSIKVLKFTPDVATYCEMPKVEQDEPKSVQIGNMTISSSFSEPEHVVHTDLKNKKVTEMREFMTRKFLIDRDFLLHEWKVTGNQKEIAGFKCMEAVRLDSDGKKIVVWFTPQIELPVGPSLYNNLPGMVLEVIENEGKKTITAKEVVFTEVNPKELIKPKDGKKVTAKEFEAIVREKEKEIGAEQLGGVSTIIMKKYE